MRRLKYKRNDQKYLVTYQFTELEVAIILLTSSLYNYFYVMTPFLGNSILLKYLSIFGYTLGDIGRYPHGVS